MALARLLPLSTVAAVAVLASLVARADVTVQQQSKFDLAIIKANSSSTEYTTVDKQRRDSDFHCEGFMSMFCGNQTGAQIIRLDRDLEYTLEPKKREYLEHRFPTAAEREAAAAKVSAAMEKYKSCPAVQQNSSAPDTSKCQMSPPKFDAKQTDQHQTFAGHDSRLSEATLTQSCHDPQTNDTCDFVFTMDSWLTQDEIAGLADRKAFQAAYLKRMGLDQMSAQVQQSLQQFLAPYKDSLKQLSDKAGDFKGYPMKTAFSISYGGAQCSAAKNAPPSASVANPLADAGGAASNAAADSAAGAAGSAAGAAAANAAGNSVAGSVAGSAASAFGSKLVSGLFHKKSSEPAPAPAAAGPPPAPNMVRLVGMTVETTSITTDAVPADKFEVPAGWKLVTPKEKPEKEFSCPASGGS
jgi:hypothetical protein